MFRGDNVTWTAKLSASDMAREFERVRTTYYTVHVAECVKKKKFELDYNSIDTQSDL